MRRFLATPARTEADNVGQSRSKRTLDRLSRHTGASALNKSRMLKIIVFSTCAHGRTNARFWYFLLALALPLENSTHLF